jgi:hypothetical protein
MKAITGKTCEVRRESHLTTVNGYNLPRDIQLTGERLMGLNKKQKKQIEVARKKIQNFQQKLAGCKQQMDDPEEVRNLENAISEQESAIEKIKAES